MSCANCGKHAEGNYSIHDTIEMDGEEVSLCDACGSEPLPTCEEIWDNIARKYTESTEEEKRQEQ